MAARRIHAKCLCGGVRIDADVESLTIAVCHCDVCRRWCGGPFMALEGARDVTIAGTDYLGLYESSGWGERGFCRNCGSSLFFRLKDASMYGISAMACSDITDAHLAEQIFIDSKPGWYELANDTKTLTGAQFLAQFASDEERPHG
ncbi:GFA family protein [Fulvimarina sp. 2208YS6-2-32]|uniref:GFA family protein n=1 Tax=Fulvimarina uroteuthidis TaxID=3098149 RepID=A0ABU5I5R4_9HYPH|nr:GFA family protein [Fulvimarina sp. 2208YS6-2-32]MDY8109491.1 GFA family protein [Fulvimarina sp. 2208YS6-2-32]